MSTASKKEMQDLHATLARLMKQRLESPGEDGIPASFIKEVREFLKDNGIQTLNVPGSDLHDLTNALGDVDLGDYGHPGA